MTRGRGARRPFGRRICRAHLKPHLASQICAQVAPNWARQTKDRRAWSRHRMMMLLVHLSRAPASDRQPPVLPSAPSATATGRRSF